MSYWVELKKRNVVKVAAAYLIAGWLLIQIAVSTFPSLGMPEWTLTFVIVTIVFCFPIALLLAWAYELTPGGIRRAASTDSGPSPGRPAPVAGYALTAIASGALGALSFWLVSPDDGRERLFEQVIPQIEARLESADWSAAFALTEAAIARFPESGELQELLEGMSWPPVTIESDPAGATVYRRGYDGTDDDWVEIGVTPIENVRLPFGLVRLRLELDGYRPVERNVGGAHLNGGVLPMNEAINWNFGLLIGLENYRLDTTDSLPDDLVRVGGWNFVIDGEAVRLNDFFLGRHEVTNADFKAFVDAGGYEQPALWDPIVRDGETIPWGEAMALFVDRTNRPGPSTWEAGDYPDGEDDHPVAGVSWHEAAAYARFAGRDLPTAHHWLRSLALAEFPWLLPASNVDGDGTRAVTDGDAMSHAGIFDMAGNVREWTANSLGDERIILGGGWDDPRYIVGTNDTSAPPLDRSPSNGIRLALIEETPATMAALTAPLAVQTTAPAQIAEAPISDDVFAAYARVFDYDPAPLNASIDATVETRAWTRERVSIDAAYGSERMALHLYLPTNARPPFQTVVYWPGWDVWRMTDIDGYFSRLIDFIVRDGRAVAFPVYRGTFDRRIGNRTARYDFDTADYRDNTIDTIKDMRRTIDYLETRREIDSSSLAFFGYSWGGVNGPAALAHEPRLKVGVINIGLLPPMTSTPEVDPVHALPRVDVPLLMFSGEFDLMVPVENAERYFNLIGTAAADKKHVVVIGGHFIPREVLISETLDWLNRYQGAVAR